MSKKSPELSFEDSIQRLNDIVENLEKGNSSLEETILIFEEGMKLTEQCRKKINETGTAEYGYTAGGNKRTSCFIESS